jgi:phytoene dehydrogenase-like protein
MSDIAIIGAGHNGLVTACLLADAGHRVTVLEARDLVGGACVSEELWPGYQVSTTSYVSTLLMPQVV